MAVSIDLNGSAAGVNAQGNVAIGTPVTVFQPNTVSITSTSGQLNRLTVSINSLLGPLLFSENLNVTSASGVTASYNSLLGVLTLTSTNSLTGTSPVSAFQQTLGSLQYNTQPLVPFVTPIDARSFSVAGFESALSVLPEATALVTLDVTNNPSPLPVNTPPVAVPDVATTTAGNAVTTGNVLSNDTDLDGDTLTVSNFTQGTSGTVVNNNNGTFTYTPNAGFAGADSFTYTVSDGRGGTAVGTVAVTVAPVIVPPVNTPPVAVPDAAATTAGNAVTTGNVLSNDTDLDGDTLTVSSFTQGTSGTVVNNNNGTFTYTPNAGFAGADSFTYTVSDGRGGTAVGTVAVTVAPVIVPPVNTPPVAVPDAATTTAGNAVTTGNVLSNDTDLDGDTLTVSSFTQGTSGTVVNNNNGTFTYTPNAGFAGADSFTYTVSDGRGGTAVGTVAVTVAPVIVPPVNTPPVAVPDAAATTAGNAVTTGNVLSNDTDLDGDTLTVSSFTQAANGTVVNNNNGTFTYTPAAGFVGADSFTYTVSDGQGGTSVGTVAVTVAPVIVPPVNTPPVAVPDAATTTAGNAVTTGNVLSNDTDLDGDTLTVSSFTQAANGTVVNNNNGTFTYTPAAGFVGADSFTYTVSDGRGGTAVGTVAVTVAPVIVPPVNTPPVAVPDAATTTAGNAVTTSNVLTNDTDLDGDTLTVSSFTQAANGTVVNNNNGTFTYTPNAGFAGADSFTYTVSDGQGGTAVGTVAVTVAPVVNPPVNTPPIATDETATTTAGNAVTTVDVLANDSDADGDDLSINNFSQGASGTVTNNGDGTFTYTPNAGFTGSDSFTYTISDGNGGIDIGTVAVTVNAANNTTNVFTGTNGSDTATASSIKDEFDMAGGDDTVIAAFDNLKQQDSIDGGSGSNTFVLTGGTATDSIILRSATVSDPNNLIGGTGLAGTTIRNFQRFDLSGFAGRTTLTVSNLQDTLIGGAGDDTVNAAFDNLKQSDNIDAGAGSNSFVLSGGTATDSITLRSATTSDANNLVTGTGLAGTVIRNFQNFDLSGFAGRATLTGNDLANTLIGGSGNDSITGGAGNDTLTGNAGNDVLNGGTGNDVLNGGAGNDRYLVDSAGDRIIDSAGIDSVTSSINLTLQAGLENLTLSGRATTGTGNSLNNVIVGNNVRNTLVGNAGNDRLFGNGGNDLLRGGLGRDRLSGGANNDRLFGDNGNDILSGDAGNDILLGGGGRDTLNGGLGSDRLTSGAGQDRLTGGAGRDSFIFDNVRTGSIDVIADFRSVDDTILVSRRGFSQNLRVGSLSASQFVLGSRAQDQDDRFLYDQRTGSLFFDADGVGAASQVRIATLSNRTAITAADIAIIA